jgi:hypothetical protein
MSKKQFGLIRRIDFQRVGVHMQACYKYESQPVLVMHEAGRYFMVKFPRCFPFVVTAADLRLLPPGAKTWEPKNKDMVQDELAEFWN